MVSYSSSAYAEFFLEQIWNIHKCSIILLAIATSKYCAHQIMQKSVVHYTHHILFAWNWNIILLIHCEYCGNVFIYQLNVPRIIIFSRSIEFTNNISRHFDLLLHTTSRYSRYCFRLYFFADLQSTAMLGKV